MLVSSDRKSDAVEVYEDYVHGAQGKEGQKYSLRCLMIVVAALIA